MVPQNVLRGPTKKWKEKCPLIFSLLSGSGREPDSDYVTKKISIKYSPCSLSLAVFWISSRTFAVAVPFWSRGTFNSLRISWRNERTEVSNALMVFCCLYSSTTRLRRLSTPRIKTSVTHLLWQLKFYNISNRKLNQTKSMVLFPIFFHIQTWH